MSDKKTGEKRPFAFSRSIRGYNKKDVNDYIAESDAAHSAEKQEFELRIAELEAALESEHLKSEKYRDEAEFAQKSAEEELARAEARRKAEEKESARKIAELEDKVKADAETAQIAAAEYKKRISEENELRLAAENEAKESEKKLGEIDLLIARVAELESALKTERAAHEDVLKKKEDIIASAEEEKKRLEAETDSKDSRRLTASAADEQARLIIKNARSEASALRRESELEAEIAREMVRTKADSALRDIYGMIDNAAHESIDVILHTVEDAEYETSVIADKLNSGNHSAATQVSCIRTELESDIERRIAAITSVKDGEGVNDEILFLDTETPKEIKTSKAASENASAVRSGSQSGHAAKPQNLQKRRGHFVTIPFFTNRGNKPSGK